MKIKLDENLPSQLASLLGEVGHNVQTVHGERLEGRKDSEIWEAAQSESRFFITRTWISRMHGGLLLAGIMESC